MIINYFCSLIGIRFYTCCFKFIIPKLIWVSNVSIIIKIRVANIIFLTRWG